MVKLGVYLLARFDLVFGGIPAFGTTLVIVGSLTMLVAAVRALSTDGFKESWRTPPWGRWGCW